MESLESIVLSPAFAVLLALVGVSLFVILTREFFLWFLRINNIDVRVKELEVEVEQLNNKFAIAVQNNLAQNSQHSTLPNIPLGKSKDKESQFPFTH